MADGQAGLLDYCVPDRDLFRHIVSGTMIKVRRPRPGEIEMIAKNAAELWVRERFALVASHAELVDKPHTKIALIEDIPVAAGGFIESGWGSGAAIAWSVIGNVPKQYFVALCRVFTKQMIATPFRFIEAHCLEEFPESHRWVICLGFKPIRGEKNCTPDGKPFSRFVFRNDHHHHG